MMAKTRCVLAFGDPVTNERPAKTRPKMAASGKMDVINLVCIMVRVDSTLAVAISGPRAVARTRVNAAAPGIT